MSKIVLIGGSAGAIKALRIILPTLPLDFPSALLIVTHIGAHKSIVPDILGRCSKIPVRYAFDGEPIVPGRVLVAPPDEHLTVVMENGKAYVRLLHGPKENHCRPAIDPLFRSAASAFLENSIGVVLSGYLDDGTVGLQAIKACGGLAIVQDPIEAEALDMPASALEHVNVDRVLSANEIGPELIRLVAASEWSSGSRHENVMPGIPRWIDIENRMAGRDGDMEDLEQIGKPSSLTCPECAGALWEIGQTGPLRYRCHTGHAYTSTVLKALQLDSVEDAIWGAIRALHEQEQLFRKLCQRERQSGNAQSAAEYEAKMTQARAHSRALRDVVATRRLVVKDETS